MQEGLNESVSKFSASIECLPSFHDVDAMGVVWHGNYLRYFEKAREELFRRLDYDYREMKLTGYIWPVVDIRVKYRNPWMLEEPAKVTATIIEYENRLKIEYTVVRKKDGVLLTKGFSIHMPLDVEKNVAILESPDILFSKLQVRRDTK